MVKRSIQSLLYSLLFFGVLFGTWVIFSGLIDPFHLTLGLISCGIVTWLSSDLLFDDRSTGLGTRLVQAGRLCAYLGWLLWQVVLSNIHLFKLAMLPGGMAEVKPRITVYRTSLKTDFEKFLLANSITLTPGTVTVEAGRTEFLVHALTREGAESLAEGDMDRRVSRHENVS